MSNWLSKSRCLYRFSMTMGSVGPEVLEVVRLYCVGGALRFCSAPFVTHQAETPVSDMSVNDTVTKLLIRRSMVLS